MSATDVFKFDVQRARMKYLRSKRQLGEPIESIDAPAQVRAMFEPELPAFLRKQAE